MAAITREWYVTGLSAAQLPTETIACDNIKYPFRGVAIDNLSNCPVYLYMARISGSGVPSVRIPPQTLKALPINAPFLTIVVVQNASSPAIGDLYVHLTEEVLQPYVASSVADTEPAVWDRTSFDDGTVAGV